ncbi:unnamed protein product [Rotaria magnacalcarata]|uniref:Uncharacterized protein n=1 Tax=Rotaria magnacalcarata TaxID=392030 RepID=A0A8S2L5Q1_9BILA|nr:unnamed protein product [Rotaria magnacalcarata]
MTRNLNLANFLPESTSILEVYENYTKAYGFNSLTFFLSSLIGFGHFGNNSSTYCAETNSQTKTSLFLVIVGASGIIFVGVYDATTTAEKILFTQKSEADQIELAVFALKYTNTKNIESLSTPLPNDILRKITFIEQSLSYPEAMRSLTRSNLFFCAPEGDSILDQLNFFDHDKDNIPMRGCASALFDGQSITRSNFHGRTIIENKTLSICVGSTGAKWLNILLHLFDNLTTDGFHPRFLLHCVEPATTIDGKESQLNRARPSIVHLYIIRGLMGNRIQVFSPDASVYIQPYLTSLNSKEPHPGIKFRATTSYEQVVERRGAELIIRLASNIQYQKDILAVISKIKQLDFLNYDQFFIDQAKSIIEAIFGPSPDLTNDVTTAINGSKMIITKQTCEEAVHIFIDVLIPQHFILMNNRVNADSTETPTELRNQTDILKLPYRFFYKTTLFGNRGVLKNIHKDEIDHFLNRLVRRGILKKGKFLKSSKQSGTYESYLKYLPSDPLEEKELSFELQKHHIQFDEYQDIYKVSAVSPDGTILTVDGEFVMKKQNVNFMVLNNHQDTYVTQSTSDLAHGQVTSIVNVCGGNAFNLANVHDEVSMDAVDQQVDQFDEQLLNSLFNTGGDVSVRSSIFDRQPQPQLVILSTNNCDNFSMNQQQLLVNNVDSPSGFSEQQQQVQTNKNEPYIAQRETSLENEVQNRLQSTTQLQEEEPVICDCSQMEIIPILHDIKNDFLHAQEPETSNMEIGNEKQNKLCQSPLQNQLHLQDSISMQQHTSKSSDGNEPYAPQPINGNDSSRGARMTYDQFTGSIPIASTPILSTESVANSSLNSFILSNASTSEKPIWSIDPFEALKNPNAIPPRILSKCKQMLLSTSPIITKTCWNRRFGGDSNLCLSAIKLLMVADLLEEGNFSATTTNTFVSWMKKLPLDTNNISDTLEFQQMKLDTFNVTWQQYASSFKETAFGHSKRFSFVSTEAAEILRSKPYSDVGFILNESAVLTKKDTSSAQNVNKAMDISSNPPESIALISPNDLSSITVDSNTRLETASITTTSVSHQLSSSIELHDVSLNAASGIYFVSILYVFRCDSLSKY